jgi:hypothetical protein
VVTAKGVRLPDPSHGQLGHGAGEASITTTTTTRRKKREEKVVVKEWDRTQGQLGKRQAEDLARTRQANEGREGQRLRSGVLEVRSANRSYIWDKGVWSDEDPQSVARVASGPVVARAEFLPAAFGGPISLGRRAVAAALPVDECQGVDPPLPKQVGGKYSTKR